MNKNLLVSVIVGLCLSHYMALAGGGEVEESAPSPTIFSVASAAAAQADTGAGVGNFDEEKGGEKESDKRENTGNSDPQIVRSRITLTQQEPKDWNHSPEEVKVMVLEYLSFQDLGKVAQVSRQSKRLADDVRKRRFKDPYLYLTYFENAPASCAAEMRAFSNYFHPGIDTDLYREHQNLLADAPISFPKLIAFCRSIFSSDYFEIEQTLKDTDPATCTELTLSRQLRIMPTGINFFPNITSLDLAGNAFEELPCAFYLLTSLTDLNLCSNKLRHIPADFTSLESLTSLNVDSNLFQGFPMELVKMTTLQVLKMGGSHIGSLPPAVEALINLKELHCNYSGLNDLPSSLSRLSSLNILCLSGNSLTTCPPVLFNLRTLNILDLSNNNMTLMDNARGAGGLTSLTDLVLENNNFQKLPLVLRELQYLRSLNISNNKLRSISDLIGALQALESLDFRGNPVKTISTRMYELFYLKDVRMGPDLKLSWQVIM